MNILPPLFRRLMFLAIFFSGLPSVANTLIDMPSTTSRAVTFKSGKYQLRGTLVAPHKSHKPFPVIIFAVGSGGESSSYTSAYYTKMLDSLFEANLPVDSVAYFYFNKRGVGGSEGKWHKTDFEERAADVKAAADLLKSLSIIDSSRIVVAGHSQGGWVTQICLSKYPESFAGGISLAGPTFGVKKQVLNDYTSNLVCRKGLSEAAASKKALRKTRFAFFLTSLMPIKAEWKQLTVIKKFQPDGYLRTIKKPLLLLFAENDALVSPNKCIDELNRLFPAGMPKNIQIATVKGANHGFKLSDLCYNGAYSAIPFSKDAKRYIRNWTKAVVLD